MIKCMMWPWERRGNSTFASLFSTHRALLEAVPTWSQCPALQDHLKSHMTWICTFRVHTHRPKWLALSLIHRSCIPSSSCHVVTFCKPCLFSCSTFHGLDLQFSICTHSPFSTHIHGSSVIPWVFQMHVSPSQYSHDSWFLSLGTCSPASHSLSGQLHTHESVQEAPVFAPRMSCRLSTICQDSLKASA